MRKKCLIITVLLAFIVAFTGCSPGGSEKALKKRVTQAWEARMSGDNDTLYNLTTDQYKEKVPRESFTYETNVSIEGFSIEGLEITEGGTKAVVRVKIKVKQKGFDFAFPISEEWLWQGDVWRLNLKLKIKDAPRPQK